MPSHEFGEHAGGRESLGAFALFYASRGFAVFPLMRGSKRPYPGTNGVKDATTRMAEVRQMWTWQPHSNIGVACGAYSDLTVLDLDVKSGANGPGELAGFLGSVQPWARQELDGVPWSSTPSGGRHLWLQGSATARLGILPGVDVKAEGGYVVAPPSGLVMPRLESGGGGERIVPYLWEEGCPCEMPAVPGWVREWTERAPSLGGGAAAELAGGSPLPEAEELKKTGLAVGSRNEVSSRLAASLFRKWGTSGEGYRKVTDEMHEIWMATDKSGGFTWSEVQTVIKHAYRYVRRREAEDREVERQVLGYLRRTEGQGRWTTG